ncbi:hypothetical protein DH2020_002245 [Rehmannia glutinosa]|uniref:Reverse transcriptase domain-containing protein n=1 Tax=Rehmannia glutinosa TaxID=99300 RepID=A0ABR0XTX0_REHGL
MRCCIRAGRGVSFPSHLLYADDIIIFCRDTFLIRPISNVLAQYEELSGTYANRDKSAGYFGKHVIHKREILCRLVMSEGWLLFVYIGVPLFVGVPQNRIWNLLRIVLFLIVLGSGILYRWQADSLMGGFLHSRFFTLELVPKRSYFSSSIWKGGSSNWKGVRHHIPSLIEDSGWIVGPGMIVFFWWDKWLGYSIAEHFGTPKRLHRIYSQSVVDYFLDGVWHFTAGFILNCSDIVADILIHPLGEDPNTRVSSRSVHGKATSRIDF